MLTSADAIQRAIFRPWERTQIFPHLQILRQVLATARQDAQVPQVQLAQRHQQPPLPRREVQLRNLRWRAQSSRRGRYEMSTQTGGAGSEPPRGPTLTDILILTSIMTLDPDPVLVRSDPTSIRPLALTIGRDLHESPDHQLLTSLRMPAVTSGMRVNTHDGAPAASAATARGLPVAISRFCAFVTREGYSMATNPFSICASTVSRACMGVRVGVRGTM